MKLYPSPRQDLNVEPICQNVSVLIPSPEALLLWLGEYLVGELRSHVPHGVAKKKKDNSIGMLKRN